MKKLKKLVKYKQGVTKCGRTKNSVQKRITGLQTGCVDQIKILFEYDTSNDILLESLVHYILDRYNREHFRCDIEYMKLVIETVGKTMDTLKSSFETISKEELLEKLGNEVYYENNNDNNNFYNWLEENHIKQDSYYQNTKYCGWLHLSIDNYNDFYNWLDQRIIYYPGKILKLKDVCKNFLGKEDTPSRISTKYKIQIEKFLKNKFKNRVWIYTDSTYKNERYKGWLDFSILLI